MYPLSRRLINGRWIVAGHAPYIGSTFAVDDIKEDTPVGTSRRIRNDGLRDISRPGRLANIDVWSRLSFDNVDNNQRRWNAGVRHRCASRNCNGACCECGQTQDAAYRMRQVFHQ